LKYWSPAGEVESYFLAASGCLSVYDWMIVVRASNRAGVLSVKTANQSGDKSPASFEVGLFAVVVQTTCLSGSSISRDKICTLQMTSGW